MGLLDEELKVDLDKEYLPESGHRIGGLVDDHGISQIAREYTKAEQEMKDELEGRSEEDKESQEREDAAKAFQVVSVMARRLEGGNRVQYGWSGNGGYFGNVGTRLLSWYDDPEMIEYLFHFGQMKLIGKPGSEKGGESWFYTHEPDGMPHWLGKSEREIFSRIAFVDYGYFYDLDNTWYYIIPGPFRIKVPLAYIGHHLNDKGYEFDERDLIERRVADFILGDYFPSDQGLQSLVSEKYPQGIEAIREDVLSAGDRDDPCHRLWEKYKAIYDYLDDWVVIKTNDDMTEITGFIVHTNQKVQGAERVETIDWKR